MSRCERSALKKKFLSSSTKTYPSHVGFSHNPFSSHPGNASRIPYTWFPLLTGSPHEEYGIAPATLLFHNQLIP